LNWRKERQEKTRERNKRGKTTAVYSCIFNDRKYEEKRKRPSKFRRAQRNSLGYGKKESAARLAADLSRVGHLRGKAEGTTAAGRRPAERYWHLSQNEGKK